MIISTMLLALLVCQDVSEVAILDAQSAKVYQAGERVAIVAQDLNKTATTGFLVSGVTASFAEQYSQFPPTIIHPVDGDFLFNAPGWVCFRGDEPQWVELKRAGPPVGQVPVAELTDLSKALATVVNDPTTASQLATVLRGLTLPEGLAEAESLSQKTIRDVLLLRQGASRDADWDKWRAPISQRLVELATSGALSTARDLQVALTALADGLSAVGQASTNGVVTMYTRANCQACERWKREIQPLLESKGWIVTIQEYHNRKSVPSFDVCTFRGCSDFEGFMSVPKFNHTVSQIK